VSYSEWFKLVATALLIAIAIDAAVFSTWWRFIKRPRPSRLTSAKRCAAARISV